MNELTNVSAKSTPIVQHPQLNSLIAKAKSHGLHAEVKMISEHEAPASVEPGCYILLGSDQRKVAKLASSYGTAAMFPAEYLKQEDSNDLFPKCTIIKSEPTFTSTIKVLESVLDNELMNNLFKRYGYKIPDAIDRRDFQILYRTYQQSLNNDEVSKTELEYLLKVVASGMTLKDYEKKHGKGQSRFSKFFSKSEVSYADKLAEQIASRTIKYEPVSENCVTPEQILELPYSKSKISVAHGENASIIKKVDAELGKHPEIKWSLKQESTITPYGVDKYQYWHTLTYPTKYEPIVAAIVNKAEYGLDQDESGRNISKLYIKNAKENISAISIPIELFNAFSKQAAKDGLEYYFDENSTYIMQTPDTIGICVEDEINRILLMQIVSSMIKSLANDSHLIKDPAYLAEKKSYQQIEDREQDAR